jgi:hypothetical protein
MIMMEKGNEHLNSQSRRTQQGESDSSPEPQPAPPPPPQPPPLYTPRPTPPPYYYPQQPAPPSVYSWELYPNVARELLKQKESKKPVFIIIGVFLIITFALIFPIAGMLVYYGSSEGLDFGDTLTIQGEVLAEDGNGLSGATITIIGTDLSAISDTEGNYIIHDAPNGIWRIKASRQGYKEKTHKVLLQSVFSDEVDFNMERGSGSEESNELWFFFSLAILMMMFSPFIVAGSFYSFKRKRFSVVLVGSILGIFTMSPSLVLGFMPSIFIMGAMGFILSSSALLMIVLNRRAFIKSRHENSKAEDSRPI